VEGGKKFFRTKMKEVNGNKVSNEWCFTILNMTPSTGIGKHKGQRTNLDVAMADKLHEIKEILMK